MRLVKTAHLGQDTCPAGPASPLKEMALGVPVNHLGSGASFIASKGAPGAVECGGFRREHRELKKTRIRGRSPHEPSTVSLRVCVLAFVQGVLF